MHFDDLHSFFEHELQGVSLTELKKCIEEITTHYRENKFFIIKSKIYALGYALVRFPATSAALQYVLKQTPQFILDKVDSLLDLGSGPGTVLSAASYFANLKRLQLIEKNPHFISFLERLIGKKQDVHLSKGDFLSFDEQTFLPEDRSSAVLASYSLGEISKESIAPFLKKLTNKKPFLFVFVEPGTPKGFATLNEVRRYFLDKQPEYTVLAPCTHQKKCPLQDIGKEKWCHFPVRLERSKAHRFLKGGTLGYEDEKISYLVIAKEQIWEPESKRILSKPRIHKGSIEMELCIPEAVERCKLSPSDPSFKKSKKLHWGDLYF